MELNNEPRQKLREIVSRYGTKIYEDKQKCKGLILDYCSNYRKEANVLIAVLEENVPSDLSNTSNRSGVPIELLMARLIQKVCDERGLDKDAAKWAVESWALASGIKVNNASEAPSKQQATRPTQPMNTSPAPIKTNSLPTRTTSPPLVFHDTATNPPAYRAYANPTPARAAPVRPRRGTAQASAQAQKPQTFGNILLIASGIVIMALSVRTVIYPHLFGQTFGYSVFPYALYLIGVILGSGRGLLASVLFIVLGAAGFPLFHFSNYPTQTIPDFLDLYLTWGGSGGFRVLYILVCPIIVYVVGSLCRGRSRKTFLGSLGVVLIGQVIYFVSVIGVNTYLAHISLSQSFTYLLPYQLGAFILAFIVAIPFHWIRAARTRAMTI